MKEFYFLFVAVIMAAACVASTIRTACVQVPGCPSENSDNYTVHVPYKDDCHRFYKCNQKCGYLMWCPLIPDTTERLVFNPELQVCDWPGHVPEGTCSPTTPPTTTPTTLPTPPTTTPTTLPTPPTTTPTTLPTPPTTTPTTLPPPPTTTPTASLNCNIPRECSPGANRKIIHEKDCRKYYICRDGEKNPVPESCQEGHIFNPTIAECDETINSKCYRTDECPHFVSS